ncbi:MAG: PBS lyase, partial [Desulfobacterales bacterium]|nr:PBS lyase [Desulfobacterales bacterium]
MVSRFSGREIIAKPTCPFCGMVIEKPGELETETQTEMPVGKCSCGAVYACDVTGHNLGTALVEA